jgi:BirA family biotin operon repressor/biotin-[acetyl-CoA-carboxylase] ligase
MRNLSLLNPFGAPVYWAETVSSTMDEARRLAGTGAPHGTVIGADFQELGRGRVRDRSWTGRAGESLLVTILLRYPGIAAIPRALTLKTGLAAAGAIEDFAPSLSAAVKWPNDIMLYVPGAEGSGNGEAAARKAAGILTEGDGAAVYVGLGVNVSQTRFPEELRRKAVSIALALGRRADAAAPARPPANAPPPPEAAPAHIPVPPAGASLLPSPDDRLNLLEKFLARLYRELAVPADEAADSWRARLEQRLYMRGRRVRFLPGAAGSGRVVEGVLAGIGKDGELLILPDGAAEPRAFFTGELDVYEAQK